MKTLLLLLLIATATVAAPAPNRAAFFAALHQVEASGNLKPKDGDSGRAIGPLQIWRVYWQDAIAADPSLGGSYADCRRLDYAQRIVAAYLKRYAAAAWAAGDVSKLARVHNGGPRGGNKPATNAYAAKVRAAML